MIDREKIVMRLSDSMLGIVLNGMPHEKGNVFALARVADISGDFAYRVTAFNHEGERKCHEYLTAHDIFKMVDRDEDLHYALVSPIGWVV